MSGRIAAAKGWAKRIKRDVVALWIDARTPLAAKIAAGAVAAYALSPVDLIPDVIPVLGLVDDLLIVPLGILLAVPLVPPALMVQFRAAALRREGRPRSRAGLTVVMLVWLLAAGLAAFLLWRSLR